MYIIPLALILHTAGQVIIPKIHWLVLLLSSKPLEHFQYVFIS